jgi:hypothetical protein
VKSSLRRRQFSGYAHCVHLVPNHGHLVHGV